MFSFYCITKPRIVRKPGGVYCFYANQRFLLWRQFKKYKYIDKFILILFYRYDIVCPKDDFLFQSCLYYKVGGTT